MLFFRKACRGVILALAVPVHCGAQVFDDVPTEYWAFSFIEALASSGITGGCGGGNYCPENNVTRAQMAVFLERGMNGSSFSPPSATGNVFLDVGAGDFAANFIEQLAQDEITSGCGNGRYCPDATVTRDQMAVFLLRAKHGPGYAPPAAAGIFGDVPATYWAASWIEQLAAEGITAGCGEGDYCPKAAVTRAQMAVFLVRIFNIPDPPSALYGEASILRALSPLGLANNGVELRPEHAATADLNGDGFDDAVIHLVRDVDTLTAAGDVTPVVILLNNGAGELVPGSGIPPPLNGVPGATPIIDGEAPSFFFVRQILIEDFNQDGQLDIFFENHGLEPQGNPDLFPGEQNALWLSGPDGKLSDVSATHLPQFSDFTHGASVADVDGDSDLDIWVNNLGANGVPPYLMTNDGTGQFTAVADLGFGGVGDNGPNLGPNGRLPAVIRNGTFPFWSAFADVDGDGDDDLYLGYMGFDDGIMIDDRAVLLLNDATGAFTLAPANAAPPPLWNSMGLVEDQAKNDVNSDGRVDLILTVVENGPNPTGHEIQFLINNGAGGFTDETASRFPPKPDKDFYVETWFADLDGDGDDDLLTGTFARREMYENDGAGVFSLIDLTALEFDWWFVPIDIDGDGQGTDFLHVRGNATGELSFYITKRIP